MESMPPTGQLLDELDVLREQDGDAEGYFIGALAALLSSSPGGPELWRAALDTARQCVAVTE